MMDSLRRLTVILFPLIWVFAVGAKDTGPELTLFFTGFVEGTFAPCGCEAGPTGGLSRRRGYSARFLQAGHGACLHVDAGNYLFPPGPYARKVNPLMIEGLEMVPVHVLNLAPGDLFHWPELARDERVFSRFLSSNLTPKSPGLPAPDPYKILTLPAEQVGTARDLQIGFLGVSDPKRVKPNSGFEAADPVDAVAHFAGQLEGKIDILVVLADLGRPSGPLDSASPVFRIANEIPAVKAVITTEKRFLLHKPEIVKNAVILSGVERGRYLGQLLLKLDKEGDVTEFEAEWIELKEGVPEDPELLQMQRRIEWP